MFAEKLNRNGDFKRIYKRATPLVGKYIVIYATKSRRSHNRLGITVSKKTGCAVKRNRIRRLISESFRLSEENIARGYDFVIVGRGRCERAKMDDVRACMISLLKDGGLYLDESGANS